MKPIKLFWIIHSSYVIKIAQVSYGFTDRCLFWSVNGKLMDLFFIKIR